VKPRAEIVNNLECDGGFEPRPLRIGVLSLVVIRSYDLDYYYNSE
jgi:hypothetical protein